MKKNILIIIALVIIDQIIKMAIVNTIGISGESISLIPNVLSLTYVQIIGAAFGLMMSQIFLIGVDLMIIIVVAKLLASKKYNFEKNAKLGMTLIIAGGIGNLIDRVFRGYVVDYIDISELFNYPVFNFADICIVVGVILVMAIIIINTIKSQENINEKI